MMINEVIRRVESMKLKNQEQIILFTGLLEKEFHFFIYGAFLVKQITN